MKVLETGLDELVNYLKERGEAKIEDISNELNYSEEVVEEWAKVLEEHDIVEVDYGITETKLKIKEHEEHKRFQAKDKIKPEKMLGEGRDRFMSKVFCDNCGKPNTLEGDPQEYAGDKFECGYCGEENKIPSEVPEDIMERYRKWKKLKKEKEEKYTCDQCGKTFDTENGLKVHKGKVHKGG